METNCSKCSAMLDPLLLVFLKELGKGTASVPSPGPYELCTLPLGYMRVFIHKEIKQIPYKYLTVSTM